VEAQAVSIERLLMSLLISPPGNVEDWRFELDQILARLFTLREACDAANERSSSCPGPRTATSSKRSGRCDSCSPGWL
jgi:hypothetical protein